MYRDWPVHAKNVDVLAYAAVDAMAKQCDPDLLIKWTDRQNWLSNADGRYDAVDEHAQRHWHEDLPPATAAVTDEQFEAFKKVGFVKRVVPERVRARCRVFLNPENILDDLKHRLRGITHSFDINNTFLDVGYLRLMSLPMSPGR